MNKQLELTKLNKLEKVENVQTVKLKGPDYTIEEYSTHGIYLTYKKYMDKLFEDMGYKNTYTAKILEEYANMYITDVGTNVTQSLYLSKEDNNFVVCSEQSISWLKSLFNQLSDMFDKGTLSLVRINESEYHTADSIVVKVDDKLSFVIYISLLDEEVVLYSMNTDKEHNDRAIGFEEEGKFKMTEIDDLDNMFITIKSPIDLTLTYNYDIKLSYSEVIDLLVQCGILKKKRKAFILTELGEGIGQSYNNGLALEYLDYANDLNWLKLHTTQSSISFLDGCSILKDFETEYELNSLLGYFDKNSKEKMDNNLLK